MKSLPVLLLWFVVAGTLSAQKDLYRTRPLTVTEGLPHPDVRQIVQDQRGYIWIATLHGIARYDGRQTRSYFPARDADPTAPTRDYPFLHDSPTGSLWIGYTVARPNLFRYDVSRDTFLTFGPADWRPIPSSVRAIYETPDRELWVATGFHGLLRFDLRQTSADTFPYRQYRHREGDVTSLPTDFLSPGMWQDERGQLWLLTEAGLSCYRPDSDDFATYTWSVSTVQNENEGLSMQVDTMRNCLWIGTLGGLVRFDLTTATARVYRQFPYGDNPNNVTASPTLGRQGQLWVSLGGFPNSTLWRFDPEAERFHPAYTLGDDRQPAPLPGANTLHTDRNGNLWSGNYNRGVQCIELPPKNVRRIVWPPEQRRVPAVDPGEVTAFAEYTPDQLFLGTREKGLWRWDRSADSLVRLAIPRRTATAPPEMINSLALSPDRRFLWIYGHSAIYRLELATRALRSWQPLATDQGYISYRNAFFWRNQLWGHCIFRGVINRSVKGVAPGLWPADEHWRDSLSLFSVSGLVPGPDPDRLWASLTNGGLVEWNATTNTFRMHLQRVGIDRLQPTPDGNVWLGTPNGLLLYDPRAEALVPLPGIPQADRSFPLSLTLDQQNHLWVGVEKGILAIDPVRKEILHRLDAQEWLADARSWYTGDIASFAASTGELFFANASGAFVVDPARIRYDSLPPQVALQQWFVGREDRPLPSVATEEIVLAHDRNDLRFAVAAFHYKLPAQNRIAYRLAGFDEAWRAGEPGRPLEYPNLPPGTYLLYVKASNSDGITGPEQLLATVRIRHPWYANPLAYASYGLLFLAFVYWLFRTEVRRRNQSAERQLWRELDTAKTHLFTNISHELRTPLTLILGDARLLLDRSGNSPTSALQRIYRGGQRLLWLVNQLLELARTDSGFLRLEPRRADIVPFLRQTLRTFAPLAEPRGIELRFRTRLDSLTMDFDAKRLQHVLSNLIHNAVKFTPDGEWIELSVDRDTRPDGDHLRLRITDGGAGLAPEDIPLVFDRFHRAPDARGGTGIGLALVRELVQLMGGRVTVESPPGQGASFYIALPITQQAPPADTTDWALTLQAVAAPAPETEPAIPTAESEQPSILIVEDDADLRSFLQTCLRDSYEITLAGDGQEGLELAGERDFDLVISDVMMPRMDGFTFCRHLKNNLETSHLPVLLLTAKADMDSRLEGFARGADAYLPKPFDPRELRARCAQLLAQRDRLRTYYQQLIDDPTNAGEAPPDGSGDSAPDTDQYDFIIRAKAIVGEHFEDEDFGVDQLATGLGLSRSQLHRKLTQMAGLSTTRFINRIRLNTARERLVDPSHTIAEVAYSCGFRDPDYFSRMFKEAFGVTPSAFRRGGALL